MSRRIAVRGTLPPLLVAATLIVKLTVLSITLDPRPYPTQRVVASATAAVILLMWSLLPLARPRRAFLAACCLNGLLTTLALVDRMHYRFFGDVLSLSDTWRAGELGQALPSILNTLRPSLIWAYIDVVLLLVFFAMSRERATPAKRLTTIRIRLVMLALGLLLSAPMLGLIWSDPEDVFHYTYSRRQVVASIGILPYHTYDLGLTILYPWRGRLSVRAADRQAVNEHIAELNAEPRARSRLFGAAYLSNVVLIQAESLQAFALGLKIGGREVTPNLDRFARECIRFPNFFDQTHLGTTSDAELLALQSLHPIQSAAVATRYAANTFRGLPAIVAEHGYATASSIGQPGRLWNMAQMHAKLGFARSYFIDTFGPGERFRTGVPDEQFFRESVARLREIPEPFLVYLMSLSNHHPYVLPEHHREFAVGGLENSILGEYLTSVHYFDQAFGSFLAEMRASDRMDSTVIVLYGDHHAYLDDPPELDELVDTPGGPAFRAWIRRKRLPLLIRLPRGSHAADNLSAGGQLDVAPTLLSLLGLTDFVGLGRDLTTSGASVVAFRDGGYVTDSQRCMPDPDGHTGVRCFDPETGEQTAEDRRAGARAARSLQVSDDIIAANLLEEIGPDAPPRHHSPAVIGHRGSPRRAPENTLASILAAIEDGADAVEVDVRSTADGVLVALHDSDLERVAGVPLELAI